MAIKYVRAPVAEWFGFVDGVNFLSKTVHERETAPIKTGLLDATGVALYKVDEPEPIGFIHHARP